MDNRIIPSQNQSNRKFGQTYCFFCKSCDRDECLGTLCTWATAVSFSYKSIMAHRLKPLKSFQINPTVTFVVNSMFGSEFGSNWAIEVLFLHISDMNKRIKPSQNQSNRNFGLAYCFFFVNILAETNVLEHTVLGRPRYCFRINRSWRIQIRPLLWL